MCTHVHVCAQNVVQRKRHDMLYIDKHYIYIYSILDSIDIFREELIVCAACRAIGTLAQCTPLPMEEGNETQNTDVSLTKLKVINKLLSLTIVKSKTKSTRINEAAVLCLGNISIGEFPGYDCVVIRSLCRYVYICICIYIVSRNLSIG